MTDVLSPPRRLRKMNLVLAVAVGLLLVTGCPSHAGVDQALLCKEKKAKAAGKKAFDLLKAFGKNVKKPNAAKLGSDSSKAESRFAKGFAKAEGNGLCLTSGDTDAIEAKVDKFVADVIGRVSDVDITAANINILHGLFCADNCRLDDRIDLLFQWLAASGCPDFVTLQEVLDAGQTSMIPLIEAQRSTVCPFPYEILYPRATGIDDALILTRYEVLDTEVRFLHGAFANFRHVLFARIDHPLGPVDVFTTHLASGSDGGPLACDVDCPLECVVEDVATNRDCQAVQMAMFIDERHDVGPPAVITGDFNDPPGSFVYNHMIARGWIDTYLAVDNPECDPVTGTGCTSGRASSLAELESTDANVDRRIDYTFLVPGAPGSRCAGATLDPAVDADGDGTATRIFADGPNPFAPCGPEPAPVCWPADHEGTEVDLNCR
jgi:endonuclease/exonuclease/phosphatase family metal-dependent hydrolase